MLFEIEQFIDWIRMRSPQARTWRDYKCDMELFVKTVGDRNVGEIQARDIDNFVNDQIQKGYKPSTVNRRLAALVSFYRFLIAEGRPIHCPVLPKRHYLREPQRLPRPVSEQDLRKYFRAIRDVRDRAMFMLMLKCGLRIGEVSALKLTDLYFGDAPSRMIIRGKGSRERTVFLSPEAEKCLQEWIRQRLAARDEHVFLSYQHRKLSTTSITTRINHVRKVSGVDLTAHRLRHSFADYLLSAGMPITSIQKLMGHRFVETTQNYAVANDKQVQADFYRACEKLEGWKLLLESVDVSDAGTEIQNATLNVQDQGVKDEENKHEIALPARLSSLSLELIQQLEAYRRIKANRWRDERVVANSILFYSQHGTLWKFFQETCGVKSASELHLDHVLHFIKARLDAGRSASTVNGSLSSLRSFLSFLKEDDVPVNPSLENIQRLKEVERLPRYMTSEQVTRLKNEIDTNVSQADDHVKQYDALLIRAVFYLLWQGGLRSGEVELLRFSDFYISKSNPTKRLLIRDGKWRKGRSVYLTDVALNAFKDFLAVRGIEQSSDFVFIKNGMPLKRVSLPSV